MKEVRMKNAITISAIVIIIGLISLISLRQDIEINIKNGRARRANYYLGMLTSREVMYPEMEAIRDSFGSDKSDVAEDWMVDTQKMFLTPARPQEYGGSAGSLMELTQAFVAAQVPKEDMARLWKEAMQLVRSKTRFTVQNTWDRIDIIGFDGTKLNSWSRN